MGESETNREEPGLRRDISGLGSALLSFNGVVGAGIFALPAALHLQFGTFSPWLFPIFGLAVLVFALPFASLASLFARTGGPFLYASAFGPGVAFQAGWLYFVARATSLAANATVFAAYAASLFPGTSHPAVRLITAALLILLLGTINIIGVRRAIRALDLLTLVKAAPLVLLALWALGSSGGFPAPGRLPSFGAVEAASLTILYAFVGFENSLVPAGETRDPQRAIPRGIVATVAATACLYFLVQSAYVAVMPAGAAPDAPLAAMSEALLGPVGGVLLALVAMASVAGNLAGNFTSTPRLFVAMAGEGALPASLGTVSKRFATPVAAILLVMVTALLLVLSGSFLWLATVSTLARLIVYALCIASLPRNRRRAKLTVGTAASVSMLLGLSLCAWAALRSTPAAWFMLLGLLATGSALNLASRQLRLGLPGRRH